MVVDRSAWPLTSRIRVCGTVLAVVLANVALNAYTALGNRPNLTIAHHVIGIALWLALPLFAVFLMWRARPAGRWILIGLFGLRAIVSLILLGNCLPLVTRQPSLLLDRPYRSYLIETVFYFGAAGWLLFSWRIRGISAMTSPLPERAG